VTCKAVVLDYIGTLVEPRDYSLEASRLKLHNALNEAGLRTDVEDFLDAYEKAHEKYRVVRYEKLREVTNSVWVSEALNNIGCKVAREDARLEKGLSVFFQDFIDSLELRPYAQKLVSKAAENCKVGLVSNFTYAPAIYASLRKLGLNRFFNAVLVSDAVGWRKPHKVIFDEALRELRVKAGEAVYVGDSPTEDIKGARAVGMKTVFVASQFYSLADLEDCGEKPDVIVEDLRQICENFHEILSGPGTCEGAPKFFGSRKITLK
jgi:FMN phosphatase YigB (HAD superfamily)